MSSIIRFICLSFINEDKFIASFVLTISKVLGLHYIACFILSTSPVMFSHFIECYYNPAFPEKDIIESACLTNGLWMFFGSTSDVIKITAYQHVPWIYLSLVCLSFLPYLFAQIVKNSALEATVMGMKNHDKSLNEDRSERLLNIYKHQYNKVQRLYFSVIISEILCFLVLIVQAILFMVAQDISVPSFVQDIVVDPSRFHWHFPTEVNCTYAKHGIGGHKNQRESFCILALNQKYGVLTVVTSAIMVSALITHLVIFIKKALLCSKFRW